MAIKTHLTHRALSIALQQIARKNSPFFCQKKANFPSCKPYNDNTPRITRPERQSQCSTGLPLVLHRRGGHLA